MQSATTTVDMLGVPSTRWAWRLMPCLTDIAFILPAVFLFLKLGGTETIFSDGDTGWHIRTGEWILAHGAVPRHDLFSYTKPGEPWFAWEWAWDILFALIHGTWGLAGVGFATVLILGAVSVLLYKLVLDACGNDVLSFALTAVALCGSSIHWLARPHLFSWLFLLVYLHLLPLAQRGSNVAFAALPILMVFWVNIHGAFLIGIFLLLVTVAGEILELLLFQSESLATAYYRSRRLLACTALCIAATFVNPYTWRLHRHVFEFLADRKLIDKIPGISVHQFSQPSCYFLRGHDFAGCRAALWSLEERRITPALLAVAWLHLALIAARNIPLFLFIAAPLVGCWLQHVLLRLRSMRFIGVVSGTICEICEELKPMERAPRAFVLSALSILLMAGLFATGAKGFEAQFNPGCSPCKRSRWWSVHPPNGFSPTTSGPTTSFTVFTHKSLTLSMAAVTSSVCRL